MYFVNVKEDTFEGICSGLGRHIRQFFIKKFFAIKTLLWTFQRMGNNKKLRIGLPF
jgi:hypothetical protein